MGIVALVVLSVTAAWTFVFGGLRPAEMNTLPVRHYWIEAGRALSRIREYQPPARKSMIVDTNGMAHSTADLTHMTKRDRSRLYLKLDIKPDLSETHENIPPPPAMAGSGAPLFQMQTEEMPLAPPKPPRSAPTPPVIPQTVFQPQAVKPPMLAQERDLSLGRKVQLALMADKTLSRSAQLTVRATSQKNRVTLRGIVLDKEEKEYIGKKVAQIAGADIVDNRLTIL